MATQTESEIESAALTWLKAMGYQIISGPEIAPGGNNGGAGQLRQVVLAIYCGEKTPS